VPNHPTPIQHSPGIPSQSNKAKEEIKGIQIGKKNCQNIADNVILYLKDPKYSSKKLLDTINSYSKVAGY
jgi:hypothetical protein